MPKHHPIKSYRVYEVKLHICLAHWTVRPLYPG